MRMYCRAEKNGDLYKGFCRDLKKRVHEHNAGENVSTKSARPWKLVYYESFLNKEDALDRERYLKTGWGRTHLERILKNYLKD